MSQQANISQRQCMTCLSMGHNSEDCIIHLDRRIIQYYSILDSVPNEFKFNEDFTVAQIDLLCTKYNISANEFNYNERLHRLNQIYIQLGSQNRRNQTNMRNLATRRTQMEAAANTTTQPSGFELDLVRYFSHLSREDRVQFFNAIRQSNIISEIGDDLHELFLFSNNNPALRSSLIEIVYSIVFEYGFIPRSRDIYTRNVKPNVDICVDDTKFNNTTFDLQQCPICLDTVNDNTTIKMGITNCNHAFCNTCIQQWINKANVCCVACPMCRNIVNTIYIES